MLYKINMYFSKKNIKFKIATIVNILMCIVFMIF